MTVLTFANHKGGTGKTTSALCFAAALGMSGRKVLVVDLDAQCFFSRMVGATEPDESCSSLALFDEKAQITPSSLVERPWFDVLPGSSRMPRYLRTLNKSSDVLWVRESLASAAIDHDIVIIDTAAAVTAYSLGSLVAADHVVIPVAPEFQPMVGAEQSFRTAYTVREKLNPTMRDPTFLITQFDARKRLHHQYRSYLQDKYAGFVLDRVVRTSASLANSYSDGTTVFDHDPRSRGAIDYANVVDEFSIRLAPASAMRETAPLFEWNGAVVAAQ